MTRQYRIQKVTGEPDWDKIEKAPLDQRLWRPCEAISAYAQLAYDESRLYVHLHAEEAQIPRGKFRRTRSAVSGQLSGVLPQRRRVRRAVFEYRTEPESLPLLWLRNRES